jgi:hypothetical protein
MKTLSIRQPWASMIINGPKPVENRTWKSNYKGRLLIHASKKYDYDGELWIMQNFPYSKEMSDILLKARKLRGGIIGAVTMTDCVEDHPSEWFSGPYAFVFDSPVEYPFIKCNGHLGFFEMFIDWPRQMGKSHLMGTKELFKNRLS